MKDSEQQRRKKEIRSKDGKMWATIEEKPYGYFVLLGRIRDGKNKGHFEIHLPDNNLGNVHPRGFIKGIERNREIVFSDPKSRKTRTIRVKISEDGKVAKFEFI